MGYPVAYRSGAAARLSTPAAYSAPAPSSRGSTLRVPGSPGSAAIHQLPRPALPPAARPYAGYGGQAGTFGGDYARSPARAPRAPASWKPPLPGFPAPSAAAPSVFRLALRLIPYVGTAMIVLTLLQLFAWLFRQIFTSPLAGYSQYRSCLGGSGGTFTTTNSQVNYTCGAFQYWVNSVRDVHRAQSGGQLDRYVHFWAQVEPYGATSWRAKLMSSWARPASPANPYPWAPPGGTVPLAPMRAPGLPSSWPAAPAPEQLPQLHPLLNPIGSPRQLPGRTPARGPGRVVAPYHLPGQGREGGYQAPGVAPRPVARPVAAPGVVARPTPAWPVVPEVSWPAPGRNPSVSIKPAPGRKPPTKGTKESKVQPKGIAGRALQIAFAATELNDLFEAIFAAMPYQWQQAGKNLPYHLKLKWLYDNWEMVDVAKAAENVWLNNAEDAAVGKTSGMGTKALKKFGASSYRFPS